MKCEKCGTEFDEPFCPNCGQSSEAVKQAAAQIVSDQNRKKEKVGIILIIIALICTVAMVLIMIIGDDAVRNNETKTKNESVLSGVNGETASDKDSVNFRVTHVSDQKSIGSGVMQSDTTNNFVVISIEITNNSHEPYEVNISLFSLTEGDNEYSYYSNALLTIDNHMYLDTINPGLSKEYVLVYETLATTKERDFKLKIKPNLFSDIGSVYIDLKEI